MCPQCHGRLAAISERTGGFSGTKAVVGAVVAGPVGVAAGALGKKLVVLQCVKCGYQIETDAQTAQEAEEFGKLYEQYERLNAPLIPMPELIEDLGKGYCSMQFRCKEYIHRAEERKKIGVDIEAIEHKIEQIEEKYDQEIQAATSEIGRLEQEKAAKTQELGKLGLFKFSEKKATQAAIDGLGEQIKKSISEIKDTYRKCDSEIVSLRSEYVERCRVLAHAAVDEYCPDDPVWKRFAHAVYSLMSSEPMTSKEFVKRSNNIDMTQLRFSKRMDEIGNPFVSESSEGWYFGPDGSENPKWIKLRTFKMIAEKIGEKIPGFRSDAEWAAQRQQNAALTVSRDCVAAIRADGTVALACIDDSQFDVSNWKNIVAVSTGYNIWTTRRPDKTVSVEGSTFGLFGVRADGTVVMTGPGIADYPEVGQWKDIIAVAAGSRHVLGLRRDGTVVAAGKNDSGQCDVTEWNDIISIAAGFCKSFGLRRDGTVIAAGNNSDGQCDVEHWERIVSISAFLGVPTGVREDGIVLRIGSHVEDTVGFGNFVAGSMFNSLSESGRIIDDVTSEAFGSEEYTGTDIVTFADVGKFRAGIRLDGTFIIQGEELGRLAEASNWTGLYVAPELKEAMHKVKEQKKQENQQHEHKKQLAEKREARCKQRAEFEAEYGRI